LKRLFYPGYGELKGGYDRNEISESLGVSAAKVSRIIRELRELPLWRRCVFSAREQQLATDEN
jgi:DNA-binding Lrp family transcriptional regulator